ncbi:MAG: hypothetical protein HC903_20605 [Methylacidiphilales bacterium]|nr:hypothetical protein [Candidatus Methylacidiphilales bacterium]NJR14259.1 hypothetical protein [Calothrix sp. CSU_2_0]
MATSQLLSLFVPATQKVNKDNVTLREASYDFASHTLRVDAQAASDK